jgi:hypothetical protein
MTTIESPPGSGMTAPPGSGKPTPPGSGKPTQPGSRDRSAGTRERVPVPTRQRRPGLAALAIVLILGGAALSGYLAISSGGKRSVLVLAREVTDGQPITAADLTTTSVSAPGVPVIPGSQLGQVASGNYRAGGTYPRGTILNSGMLVGKEIPGRNYTAVAVQVVDGQYPPDAIGPSSAVKVIYTPSQDTAKSSGDGSGSPIDGLRAGDTLVPTAFVSHLQKAVGSSGGGVILTLVVPNDEPSGAGRGLLSNLALANAQHAVTVVKLPVFTPTTTGTGGS